MGHEDPKHGHHHHEHQHEHDDVIGAVDHGHAHVRVHQTVEGHTHEHAHAGSPARASRPTLPHGAGVGRVLHFDCFAGLSGDMIVGSLLDLGVPTDAIQRALEALPVGGFDVGTADRVVSSIAATKFMVRVHEGQPFRAWRDIRVMLERATLDEGVRRRALETFRVLAVAEGRIHRIDPDDVHFHEVGAIDAIVDIVAASAALEWLGARLSCAPLPMGRGFARTEHGIIPLPAPAVVEILAGIPTEATPVEMELVTPTGAAIVRANATEFVRWPSIEPVVTGFGAGTRTLTDRPNLLRVVLGDVVESANAPSGGTHVVIEANLDDATGEMLAHATEALLRAGALDAWTAPIGMKKGRPGVMVSALGTAGDAQRLAKVLMSESTTLGVRVRPIDRIERPRRTATVQTEFGPVDVKVADGDGLPVTAKPEDSVVQAIAREKNVPAKSVYAAALAAFWGKS